MFTKIFIFQFLISTVIVQDGENICSNAPLTTNIEGYLKNYKNEPIYGFAELYKNNTLIQSNVLSNGYYNFGGLVPGQYAILIKNNDNPINGVSTADILHILKHILGIKPFSNLSQRIAADVNLSNSITAADLAEIRKLILGIEPEFKRVPSWVFIPLDSFRLGIIHPSQFNQPIEFEVKNDNLRMDFIGIKMGDVN